MTPQQADHFIDSLNRYLDARERKNTAGLVAGASPFARNQQVSKAAAEWTEAVRQLRAALVNPVNP
jgi:hypothetical protein